MADTKILTGLLSDPKARNHSENKQNSLPALSVCTPSHGLWLPVKFASHNGPLFLAMVANYMMHTCPGWCGPGLTGPFIRGTESNFILLLTHSHTFVEGFLLQTKWKQKNNERVHLNHHLQQINIQMGIWQWYFIECKVCTYYTHSRQGIHAFLCWYMTP